MMGSESKFSFDQDRDRKTLVPPMFNKISGTYQHCWKIIPNFPLTNVLLSTEPAPKAFFLIGTKVLLSDWRQDQY